MAAYRDDVTGGYDVTFATPQDKDYECPICLSVLRDPVQTPCGHSFCKSCFNGTVSQCSGDEATCPLDKKVFSKAKVFDDVRMQRKILSLITKCTNQEERQERRHHLMSYKLKTCEWIGELRAYKDHVEQCLYEKVQCTNDCGEKLQRKNLEKHLRLFCSRRRSNCQHCATELEQKDMEAHMAACLKFPLLCELKCGIKVKREDMTLHVSESGTCPNTPLPCPFKDSGCDVKPKRHAMDKHLNTSIVQHQLLQQQTMAREQQVIAAELSQLRDENMELKRKLGFVMMLLRGPAEDT